MSLPLKRTLPCDGGVSPMIERMVVVLPTPLRPSRQTHSPCLMSSEMPNSTRLRAVGGVDAVDLEQRASMLASPEVDAAHLLVAANLVRRARWR